MEQLQNGNQRSKYYLFIDGGTSTTRITLMYEDKMLCRRVENIGAACTGKGNDKETPAKIIYRSIMLLEQQYGCRIEEAFASGMITSATGLWEVEHIKSPASKEMLAREIKKIPIEEEGRTIWFHFIPGIKFTDDRQQDVMRGEETEIVGIMGKEQKKGKFLFLHFGSHNKCIQCKDGAINRCITTIGGELLWAALQDTILRASVKWTGNPFCLVDEFVKSGFLTTQKHGLTRSLFQTRLLHLMDQAKEEELLSYLYGCFVYEDFMAFSDLLKEDYNEILLYGRETFTEAFKICSPFFMKQENQRFRCLTHEESEGLSLLGMQILRDRYYQWKEGENTYDTGSV